MFLVRQTRTDPDPGIEINYMCYGKLNCSNYSTLGSWSITTSCLVQTQTDRQK